MSAAATPVRKLQAGLGQAETPALTAERPAASREQIAELAYSLWLLQGCPDGCAEANWLDAERQLAISEASGRNSS